MAPLYRLPAGGRCHPHHGGAGAPAIGVAAAYAYCLAALAGEGLDEAKETLAAAGPQRSTLFWALERMEHKAKECGGAAEPLIAEAKAIHAEDVAMCRAMGAHGAAVVPEHARILTHCNAGALATGRLRHGTGCHPRGP